MGGGQNHRLSAGAVGLKQASKSGISEPRRPASVLYIYNTAGKFSVYGVLLVYISLHSLFLRVA